MDQPAALQKRRQPGRGRAIVLAIIVHAAFLALIVFGVRWQSLPTVPVAADLWNTIPTTKKAAPPPPQPKPQPSPPKPQPAPPPPQPAKTAQFGPSPPPPAAKPLPQPTQAEIAEKAAREKARRDKEAADKKAQQEAAAKKAQEEAAAKKAQAEAAARKKADEEAAAKKKAQEAAARKKREEEQKRLAEQIAKAEEADRERQAAATARQMEIQSWVDKIKAKILNRAVVPDTVATGTEVNVRIRILPGGDVLDITVTRSESPTYSAAIERAIRSAQPLPVPPANSDLFPEFRDLNLNFRHER